MARTTRTKKTSGPPIGGLIGLGVVMAGAVVLARMAAQDKAEAKVEPEEIQASDIFGDLPAETPPEMTPQKETNSSPENIAETECWVKAKEVAARANVVFAVAKEAKSRDDHVAWNEKGKEAKELYNEAIKLAVDWEGGLLEEYGEYDRRVRAISSELNGWFKRLEVLAKTTSR